MIQQRPHSLYQRDRRIALMPLERASDATWLNWTLGFGGLLFLYFAWEFARG
jgi:hypothetical protein